MYSCKHSFTGSDANTKKVINDKPPKITRDCTYFYYYAGDKISQHPNHLPWHILRTLWGVRHNFCVQYGSAPAANDISSPLTTVPYLPVWLASLWIRLKNYTSQLNFVLLPDLLPGLWESLTILFVFDCLTPPPHTSSVCPLDLRRYKIIKIFFFLLGGSHYYCWMAPPSVGLSAPAKKTTVESRG